MDPVRKKRIVLSSLHWRHAHGVGGVVFLVACALEICLCTVRGQPTPFLTALVCFSSLPFGLGLFTRSFRKRLVRLNHRRFIFFRATAWIYAFIGLACSVYAQPVFTLNVSPLTWAFTAAFAVFTLLSMAIAIFELQRMTLFTDGFLIANLTSGAMLLCLPLLHLVLGTEQLATWYVELPIGKVVYLLSLFTGLVASMDTFVLGLVTNRRAYYEQYKKSSAILWGGLYMTGSFLALAVWISWMTGLVYLIVLTLVFALSSRVRFPIIENQKGLLGQD